jgi:hypothetical protein
VRHPRLAKIAVLATVASVALVVAPTTASATPVCTDGYEGGPPLATCGGRIFPEVEYLTPGSSPVRYEPDATGFREYQHGIEFMAEKYNRWVRTYTLSSLYGETAKSVGADGIRAHEDGDTGDGLEIHVIELTDHEVPNEGKESLFFSLSVHGNERGGLEGGLRAVEDLAIAATDGGTIADGVDNYDSETGKPEVIHEYEVTDVLAKEVVYFVDFNVDGWAMGETLAGGTTYNRGNRLNTDLNRQMPTIGRINITRNPLEEREMKFGTDFMQSVADRGRGGLMAYGADIHGELNSRAYVDIMYPAGQFDSVKHRQLMAIAERTKSVIDDTLYMGIQDEIEAATGGNGGEGIEDTLPVPENSIPTMPAHWGTVWDTLGYTDTGFIGDYLASELGVTGMDYEIFLNHTYPHANSATAWNPYLVENHINASRAIIKTAMAYALFQSQDFNEDNVEIETGGQAGYVVDPLRVTNADGNGPGELPGPDADGLSANGEPVAQKPYSASNQDWFTDTARLMPKPFKGLKAADIANDSGHLDQLDTLVLADLALPKDADGRAVNAAAYYSNIRGWVERGGNLVLTDRALHALEKMGVVEEGAVTDTTVYQPYTDLQDFEHPLTSGLRANARQLVECAILGYEIGDSASPMTTVESAAFTDAGGAVVGTTPNADNGGGAEVSLGEIPVGKGLVRVIGGALPTPTEENDHRYGLKSYGLTYSGLFVMENAIRYDASNLGTAAPRDFTPTRPKPRPAPKPAPANPLPATGGEWELAALGVALLGVSVRLRRRRRTV